MCELCDPSDVADCAYEPEEKHPDQWSGGQPTDSNGRRYNPHQGSVSPTEGRCNALLSAWRDRYGEPRYCMALPESTFVDDGSEFCRNHKSRDALMKRAQELFTHGLYSRSIEHVLAKLPAWQKVQVLAYYESYLSESVYDFDGEEVPIEIDVGEEVPPFLAPEVTDGTLTIAYERPSEHTVRAVSLFRAALYDIMAMDADRARGPSANDDDGVALETVDEIDLSEVIDDIPDDADAVVEQEEEHHLNLPVSRLDKDKSEFLEFGGVPVESDADVEVNVTNTDELIADLDEAPELDTGGESPPSQSQLADEADDLDVIEADDDAVAELTTDATE